jgi:hypothetical protein
MQLNSGAKLGAYTILEGLGVEWKQKALHSERAHLARLKDVRKASPDSPC